MKWAYLFPGQGSQHVGMGSDLRDAFAEARRTLEEADEALGYALSRLCAEGPEETLALTEHAQPAILTVGVMIVRVLGEHHGPRPSILAGHSLGEYTALVAAGAMAFSDAIRVVRARGRMMQEAVPVGAGAMAAIVGLSEGEVQAVCAEARRDGEIVAPANFNGGGQIVIAGHAGAVDRAGAVAKVRGARLVRRLPVSAPFHCALMAPAARALAVLLQTVPLRRPAVPVVSSIDGAVVSDPVEIGERLAAQVAQPVRWDRCMRTVAAQGCVNALEIGPGNALSALTRRMEIGVAARPAGTVSTLRPLLGGATV